MKRRLGLLWALMFLAAGFPWITRPTAALAEPAYTHTVSSQADWNALAASGLQAGDTLLLTGQVEHGSAALRCQSITVARGGSLTLRTDLAADITVLEGARYTLLSGTHDGNLTTAGGETTLLGKVSGTVWVQGGTLTFQGGSAQRAGLFKLDSRGGILRNHSASTASIEVASNSGVHVGTLAPGKAFSHMPAPQNPRWDGTTMRWDAVAHADAYQILVRLKDNPGTGSLSKRVTGTSLDGTADLQAYAPDTFTFEVAAMGATVGDITYLDSRFSAMSAPLVYPQPVAIAQQPLSQHVPAGSAARFAVQATGDAPTYQWQMKAPGAPGFADVPGANAATLQVPDVARALHGSQYRCVVRNVQGSAVSQPAVLQVYAAADPSALYVHGLFQGQSIAQGDDAPLTATGVNMDLADPHTGDERLRPTAYRIIASRAEGNASTAAPLAQGALTQPGYGATLQTGAWPQGSYTLLLSCVLERYVDGQWMDVGDASPAYEVLQFSIAAPGSVPSPGQTPAQTPGPAATPDGASPSTGQTGLPAAVPIALIALAAIALAAALYFGRKR